MPLVEDKSDELGIVTKSEHNDEIHQAIKVAQMISKSSAGQKHSTTPDSLKNIRNIALFVALP